MSNTYQRNEGQVQGEVRSGGGPRVGGTGAAAAGGGVGGVAGGSGTVDRPRGLGLSTRNYHRAVEAVLPSYGIEKSSVSRHFVQATAQQLRELCEQRLGS